MLFLLHDTIRNEIQRQNEAISLNKSRRKSESLLLLFSTLLLVVGGAFVEVVVEVEEEENVPSPNNHPDPQLPFFSSAVVDLDFTVIHKNIGQ